MPTPGTLNYKLCFRAWAPLQLQSYSLGKRNRETRNRDISREAGRSICRRSIARATSRCKITIVEIVVTARAWRSHDYRRDQGPKVVVVAGGGESKVVGVAESRGECGGRTRPGWPGWSSSPRWFPWPLTGPPPAAAAPWSSVARAGTRAASFRRSRRTRLSRARATSHATATTRVSSSPTAATTSRRPAVVRARRFWRARGDERYPKEDEIGRRLISLWKEILF